MQLTLWACLGLLGLGALHGINPAMGWLFAVALGLQEKRGRAVWRALPPLALGHALAIAVVVAVAALVGQAIPPRILRWIVACTLLGFGAYRLLRHRHPRYGGMRVGPRELTIWSFLMATAHGAGLMLLPFVIGARAATQSSAVMEHAGHAAHAMHQVPAHAGIVDGQIVGLAMTLLHTAGYLVVSGAIAILVYRRFGLRLLRTAWINLDLVWSVALVATAVATLLL